jgi:hypothetical protein
MPLLCENLRQVDTQIYVFWSLVLFCENPDKFADNFLYAFTLAMS